MVFKFSDKTLLKVDFLSSIRLKLEFSSKVRVILQSKEKNHTPPKIARHVVFQVTKILCAILTVGIDSLTPSLYPKT